MVVGVFASTASTPFFCSSRKYRCNLSQTALVRLRSCEKFFVARIGSGIPDNEITHVDGACPRTQLKAAPAVLILLAFAHSRCAFHSSPPRIGVFDASLTHLFRLNSRIRRLA